MQMQPDHVHLESYPYLQTSDENYDIMIENQVRTITTQNDLAAGEFTLEREKLEIHLRSISEQISAMKQEKEKMQSAYESSN